MKNDHFSKFLLTVLLAGLLLAGCAAPNADTGNASGNGAQNGSKARAATPSPFQPRGNSGKAPAASNPALFKGPLSVQVDTIADNSTVKQDKVIVGGTADSGTVITVNDAIAAVGKSRQFSVTIQLEEGLNVLEITASDPQGNQDTVYLTVTYDPNA